MPIPRKVADHIEGESADAVDLRRRGDSALDRGLGAWSPDGVARLEIEARAGPRAAAKITTQAAEKVYRSAGRSRPWTCS